jgi:hypothetical protein
MPGFMPGIPDFLLVSLTTGMAGTRPAMNEKENGRDDARPFF